MKMKSLKLVLAAAVATMFVMAGTGAFAAVECLDMQVIKTGSKVIGGAQVNVIRAKPATGTCGNMTTTSNPRTFNFSDVNGDAGLATALTALSLGQNVYLYLTDDNAVAGTTVEIIQISAP